MLLTKMQLMLQDFGGGIPGDVAMQNSARPNFHRDEDVAGAKRLGDGWKESHATTVKRRLGFSASRRRPSRTAKKIAHRG